MHSSVVPLGLLADTSESVSLHIAVILLAPIKAIVLKNVMLHLIFFAGDETKVLLLIQLFLNVHHLLEEESNLLLHATCLFR